VATGKRERAKLAVLKALHELGGAAGASRIAQCLAEMGTDLQPRTVRLYLLELDSQGLTRFVSRRRGRSITDRGLSELSRSHALAKPSLVSARVDGLSYSMSFSSRDGCGDVIANVAIIDERAWDMTLREINGVLGAGLGIGTRFAVARAGEKLGNVRIPEGRLGIGTICSVTVNGLLLREGIAVTSRFGGLLELRDGSPVRFVELIEYSGSTLDPLEVFIKAGMTTVRECARTGNGTIGVSFREIPSAASPAVRRIAGEIEKQGLGGVLYVGEPNRPLLDVSVGEGRTGLILCAGLNPIAAVYEAGIRVSMSTLSGLEAYDRFKPVSEIGRVVR
jgi:HTH-type transcriptional regulator, global nitrogen regulator NrpRI